MTAGIKQTKLASEIKRQKSKSSKSQTGMTTREAPPTVLEDMRRRLRAYIDRRQAQPWVLGTGQGLATLDEVWTRTTDGDLDELCDGAGDGDRQPQAESAMVEIPPGSYEQHVEDGLRDEGERDAENPECIRAHTLLDGVGVLQREIGERKVSLEPGDVASDIVQDQPQDTCENPVWGIRNDELTKTGTSAEQAHRTSGVGCGRRRGDDVELIFVVVMLRRLQQLRLY